MKKMLNSRVLAAGMTILAVLCLTGCHKETEEDGIKKMILAIEESAREKDSRAVLEHISKTYHDPQGNNYDAIKDLLVFSFLKHQQVHAYVTKLDISIENNTARASFQAVLTGAGGDASAADKGLLPEALGVYAFAVVMQKESGAWKIGSATWELLGEGPVQKE